MGLSNSEIYFIFSNTIHASTTLLLTCWLMFSFHNTSIVFSLTWKPHVWPTKSEDGPGMEDQPTNLPEELLFLYEMDWYTLLRYEVVGGLRDMVWLGFHRVKGMLKGSTKRGDEKLTKTNKSSYSWSWKQMTVPTKSLLRGLSFVQTAPTPL